MKTLTKITNPIFIVGSPRSGTTMLAAILNKHSNIASATETHFFNFISKQKKYNWQNFSETDFVNFLDEARVTDFTTLVSLKKDDLLNDFRKLNTPINKKDVFDLLINAFLFKKGKERFCEKTPQHLQNVEEILSTYPEAKIVHIVRDGRDTVNSLMKMPWRPQGLLNNCRFWIGYAKLALGMSSKPYINSNNYLLVKSEDLLQNSESILRRIMDFVGEEFEISVLDHSGVSENIFADWENTWKHKANESLDPSRIGAWKREIKGDDAVLLEYLLADSLIKLGYASEKPKLNQRLMLRLGLEYIKLAFAKLRRVLLGWVN